MTIKLEVLQGTRLVESYEFKDGEAKKVVIGRHESCDVILDEEEGVSRRHCEIVSVGEGRGYLLRDLGSSNGTFVKGRKIKTHSLNNKDTFSVCSLTLRFLTHAKWLKAEALPEVGLVPDLTFRVNASTEAEKIKSSRFSRLKGYLLIGSGRSEQNYVLHESLVLIGSDPEAGVTLTERGAPRAAAVIVREDMCFRAIDVSPRGNWLKVNGAMQPEVILQRGDDIEVGQLKIKYFSGLPKLKPKLKKDPTKRWKP